jgi:hypothetical protein
MSPERKLIQLEQRNLKLERRIFSLQRKLDNMKTEYEAKLKAKKQIVITEEKRAKLIERRDAALKSLR